MIGPKAPASCTTRAPLSSPHYSTKRPDRVTVNVLSSMGSALQVKATAADTILRLKERILYASGIAVNQQCILHGSAELSNYSHSTLGDLASSGCLTVTLIVKAKSGLVQYAQYSSPAARGKQLLGGEPVCCDTRCVFMHMDLSRDVLVN